MDDPKSLPDNSSNSANDAREQLPATQDKPERYWEKEVEAIEAKIALAKRGAGIVTTEGRIKSKEAIALLQTAVELEMTWAQQRATDAKITIATEAKAFRVLWEDRMKLFITANIGKNALTVADMMKAFLQAWESVRDTIPSLKDEMNQQIVRDVLEKTRTEYKAKVLSELGAMLARAV